MRIEPRELIAGISMLKIRDLLHCMHNNPLAYYTQDGFAYFLQIDESEVGPLVTELLQRQLITPHPETRESHDGQPRYDLTHLGARLAAAKGIKPLKRKTAERLLSEFMARIEPINQNDYFLYRVERVVLFGSYLSDKPLLSDIDLIVHLAPKEADEDLHEDFCYERNCEYLARGWSVGWMNLEVFWDELPRREAMVALRHRSAYLSLHGICDELIAEREPHQVLYGAEKYVTSDSIRELYSVDEGTAK